LAFNGVPKATPKSSSFEAPGLKDDAGITVVGTFIKF
jgi:hypothetical protein